MHVEPGSFGVDDALSLPLPAFVGVDGAGAGAAAAAPEPEPEFEPDPEPGAAPALDPGLDAVDGVGVDVTVVIVVGVAGVTWTGALEGELVSHVFLLSIHSRNHEGCAHT